MPVKRRSIQAGCVTPAPRSGSLPRWLSPDLRDFSRHSSYYEETSSKRIRQSTDGARGHRATRLPCLRESGTIKRTLTQVLLGLVIAGTSAVGTAQQPLLLTEIVVTPEAGEYIEIHNPNGVAVDLSNVYLSDATFAPNSVFYYNVVTGNRVATGGGAFADFTARFPDGATIPAGAHQVIALAGSDNFFATHGVNPDYELFEDGASTDAIPDMREAIPASINDQGNLTDSGEVVILFSWDGVGDLVQDLDYVVWGDQAEAVDKTGVVIDGPDGDNATSSYLADTPIGSQQVVSLGTHPGGASFQRDDLGEGSEAQSGGNGVTGSDETSENLQDTWCTGSATPGAATQCFAPAPPLVCGEPASLIHDVQGAGSTSPLAGTTVIVEAVVVADFANGVPTELNGFFLQEEDADADGNPATSEGIFVLTNLLDVEAGDRVRVRGLVDESSGLTQLTTVDSALICASGLSVTPAELTLPYADLAALEAIEGMAVNLPQTLRINSIANVARFGEFTLAPGRLLQPTQVATPGAAANAQAVLNGRSQILVNDGRNGSNQQPFVQGQDNTNPLNAGNPVRVGQAITGLQGVMNFTFNFFKIEPRAPFEIDDIEPRAPAPGLADGPLRVAAMNLQNWFSTLDDSGNICGPAMNQGCRGADTASELTRQADKLASALLALDADIVALSEIENNASDSLEALVGVLNAATAPGTWDYVDAGVIGADAIKVGLLYVPATVGLVGTPAVLDASVDPNFDSSLNRPVLAQTFVHLGSGERLTVSASHFRARSCGGATGMDTDQGDGQRCFNASRTSAAQALRDWLESDPTGSGDPDYLILGDLNSYPMEDPIQALLNGGLVDLGAQFVSPERAYSFNFFGASGALDYAIASPGLAAKALDAAYWPINADELGEFSYDEEDLGFGIPKPANFYNPDPYRSSDHDPIIVVFAQDVVFVDGFEE